MQTVFNNLRDDLNADISVENEKLMDVSLQVDKQWSYVESKKNQQWLWAVMGIKTRLTLAFQVGNRAQEAREELIAKVPQKIKKDLFIMKLSSQSNTNLWEKDQEKLVTLNDLAAQYGNDVNLFASGCKLGYTFLS